MENIHTPNTIHMKKYVLVLMAAFVCTMALYAQNTVPKGFVDGTIVLNGSSTTVPGFLKTSMCEGGKLVFIATGNELQKKYLATDLLAVNAGNLHFITIGGDFFKLISDGELCFLQKASNESNSTVYNGNEAIFVKGTAGRVNDYFFYNRSSKKLALLTKKNREALVTNSFAGCAAAIAKAAETGDDLAGLSHAVELYNQSRQISAK
jgi:hypothetical protein